MGKSKEDEEEFKIGYAAGHVQCWVEFFARGQGISQGAIAARLGQVWGASTAHGTELGDADQVSSLRSPSAERTDLRQPEVEVDDIPRRPLPGEVKRKRNTTIAPIIMEMVANSKKILTRKEVIAAVMKRMPDVGVYQANGACQGLVVAGKLRNTPKGIVLDKMKYVKKEEPPALPVPVSGWGGRHNNKEFVLAMLKRGPQARIDIFEEGAKRGIPWRSILATLGKLVAYKRIKKLKDGRYSMP